VTRGAAEDAFKAYHAKHWCAADRAVCGCGVPALPCAAVCCVVGAQGGCGHNGPHGRLIAGAQTHIHKHTHPVQVSEPPDACAGQALQRDLPALLGRLWRRAGVVARSRACVHVCVCVCVFTGQRVGN
jgi:hypothetical protein